MWLVDADGAGNSQRNAWPWRRLLDWLSSSLDHQAFASAWKTACSLDNAVFLVPAGRRYKVGAIQFVGPCKDRRMIIQVTRVASVQLNA
jgi:hypothetical protein